MTRLSPREFAAFLDACDNAPEPTQKLRALMADAATLWDETAREPVPDGLLKLVARLK
jgi:hypothetical protein